MAAGAYNVNTAKLGANLISLMRSNQRAISNAIATEPRRRDIVWHNFAQCASDKRAGACITCASKKCRSSRVAARLVDVDGRHERPYRREVARDASRSRRGVGFRRGRVRRVERRLPAPIGRSLAVGDVPGVVACVGSMTTARRMTCMVDECGIGSCDGSAAAWPPLLRLLDELCCERQAYQRLFAFA